MKTINSILKEEEGKLRNIVKQAIERVKMAPKGFLRISNKHGRKEYYYKSEKSVGNGRYMRKEEYELVKKIVQRDYDAQIIKAGEERIEAIRNFLETYERTDLRNIYTKTNQYRRELITTSILSDEEYIKQWENVKYEGKSFVDDEQEIITEKGERVRSKSEKIIADKLYALGIPYRYEYPLVLEGNIKIYPDFTILKMPAREEIYLEHLGMMDNTDYIEHVMYKLNTYEKNGIYIGINLFITHETSKMPLNTRTLDAIIRALLIE